MANFDTYKDVQTLEVTKYQEAKNGPDGQPLKNEKGEPVVGASVLLSGMAKGTPAGLAGEFVLAGIVGI